MQRDSASMWGAVKEVARQKEERNGEVWGALLAYEQFRNASTGETASTRAPGPTNRQKQKRARKFQWEIPVLVDPLAEDVYPDDYSRKNKFNGVGDCAKRYLEGEEHGSDSCWLPEQEYGDGDAWKGCDGTFKSGDQGFCCQENFQYHDWHSSSWLKNSLFGETSTSEWKGQPGSAGNPRHGYHGVEWRRSETGRSCTADGVTEKVEKIVAGIWEKVEREMGCQGHPADRCNQARWHQQKELDQSYAYKRKCDVVGEKTKITPSTEIKSVGGVWGRCDASEGRRNTRSQHQTFFLPEDGSRTARGDESGSLREMIDWVNKHEYQLEPTARRIQPRAWEDLSFADRTLLYDHFVEWLSTAKHTKLRETAAEIYAGQQRRIRCFRIWLLALISTKEAARRRQAAEHARSLHRLKIADEFHSVFHLHRLIRAWRAQVEEEQIIRQKVARCRAEADQETMQGVIADKFRGCYLLNKSLRGWRRARKDGKEERHNQMDESTLHDKILKVLRIVNSRQHTTAPVDCDEEKTVHCDFQAENEERDPAQQCVSDDRLRAEISEPAAEAGQPPSDEPTSQIQKRSPGILLLEASGGPHPLALEEGPCICVPSKPIIHESTRPGDIREALQSLNDPDDIMAKGQKLTLCEEGDSFDNSRGDDELRIGVGGEARQEAAHPSLFPSDTSVGALCKPPSRSHGVASANHAALVLGRELASRQAALARMHCARSTLSRFGWNPWRLVLEMRLRRNVLADVHRRLKVLKVTIVNWRLALLPGRWEEVIREVGHIGRARVHHQVSKLSTSFEGWYALSRTSAFKRFTLKRKCFRALKTIKAEGKKAQNLALRHIAHRTQKQCLRCWSSLVEEEVSERIVLELKRESRVRSAIDTRKKSVCLKAWRLLYTAARLERVREEEKNSTWDQVRGWIDDFRQERQKPSPVTMEISFDLEDNEEGKRDNFDFC